MELKKGDKLFIICTFESNVQGDDCFLNVRLKSGKNIIISKDDIANKLYGEPVDYILKGE